MHNDVDRFSDQTVEGRHRQLTRGVRQLTDEAKSGESLAGRAGMDRGKALDSGRQRQEQGECFTVANLADDGDVRRHAKETGDQAAEVDLTTVGARRTRL